MFLGMPGQLELPQIETKIISAYTWFTFYGVSFWTSMVYIKACTISIYSRTFSFFDISQLFPCPKWSANILKRRTCRCAYVYGALKGLGSKVKNTIFRHSKISRFAYCYLYTITLQELAISVIISKCHFWL